MITVNSGLLPMTSPLDTVDVKSEKSALFHGLSNFFLNNSC